MKMDSGADPITSRAANKAGLHRLGLKAAVRIEHTNNELEGLETRHQARSTGAEY